MRESDAYERWYHDQFLVRYPKPPRDETPITNAECARHGFSLGKTDTFETEFRLSLDEYIELMVTPVECHRRG